jgi:hypothetical protein
MYLDFDGRVIEDTAWNTLGTPFTVPPYSHDSDPAFDNVDKIWAKQIWAQVAEDYRPFNINVTTIEPEGDAIVVAIGGQCTPACPEYGAWITHDYDTPVIVAGNNWGGYPRYVGGYVSYATARMFGLHKDGTVAHDGFPATEYYGGHGGANGWGSIAGRSIQQPVTQWSKGEYPHANNFEDDIAILTSILGARPDQQGIIETQDDTDVYTFHSSGGMVTIDVDGAYAGNLNIGWELRRANGALYALESPVNSLDATASVWLSPGNYELHISGVAQPAVYDVASDQFHAGNSDYGSLGAYTVNITGSVSSTIASALEATHTTKKARLIS